MHNKYSLRINVLILNLQITAKIHVFFISLLIDSSFPISPDHLIFCVFSEIILPFPT